VVVVGFLHVRGGICHARVGDGGTCSPDTVTCPKKNAARGRGIEPALA